MGELGGIGVGKPDAGVIADVRDGGAAVDVLDLSEEEGGQISGHSLIFPWLKAAPRYIST
jgi:hypothetical protein